MMGLFRKPKVDIEIDYEKLIEAIVKANKLSAENERNKMQLERIGFPKLVWAILRGKMDTGERFTTGLFTIIPAVILGVFAIALISASIFICIIIGINVFNIFKFCSTTFFDVMLLIGLALLSIFLFILGVFIIGAAREIARNEDRTFAMSVCSSLTGFIAIIVAAIALYIGVVQ